MKTSGQTQKLSHFHPRGARTESTLQSVAYFITLLRCSVLAIAGFGYALFQCYVKPSREVLLNRLVLSAAFVLWAVEQLIPPGRLALFFDDTVIAGFVLDLLWIVRGQRKAEGIPCVTSLSSGVERVKCPEKRESVRVKCCQGAAFGEIAPVKSGSRRLDWERPSAEQARQRGLFRRDRPFHRSQLDLAAGELQQSCHGPP